MYVAAIGFGSFHRNGFVLLMMCASILSRMYQHLLLKANDRRAEKVQALDEMLFPCILMKLGL